MVMLIASLFNNINKLINHVTIYSQINICSFVLATNSYFINEIEMRLEQPPTKKPKKKKKGKNTTSIFGDGNQIWQDLMMDTLFYEVGKIA